MASAETHAKYIQRRNSSPLAWRMFLACLFIAGYVAAPGITAQEVTGSTDGRPDGRGNRPRSMAPRTVPGNGPSNAAGVSFDTGNQIQYNGGPVLLGTTNMYYIWYGNWDSSSIDILTNFGSSIGGSPYFNINTGYFDGQGRSVSNSVSLGSTTHDSYSRGSSLRNSDIWAIVSSALSSGRLPVDSNGAYFVLTSGDVQVSGFPSSLCGWHSKQTFNSTSIRFAFVGNPVPQGVTTCAPQIISPNANAGADAMASTIAHELEEAVTDPNLDAWYDSAGNENADKCAWNFGTTYLAVNGAKANMRLGAKDYLIQQNWVNANGGFCALSYSPGPDFALSAAATSQLAIAGGVTAPYSVAIIPVKGFAGTITFSVSGLPTGATASAVPASSTSTSFTVSTAANLAGGNYSFTLTGTSGSVTHSTSLTLVVSGQTLSPVTVSIGVISPEPSLVGQPYSVNYSITSAAGTPTGIVTVSDGAAKCTAAVAAGSCTLSSSTAGTKVISVAYAGDGQFTPLTRTRLHSVLNGGSLADLASGSGWETTFTLVNLGASAASLSLNLFGDSGGALSLPFTFPQTAGSVPLSTSKVTQTLGSNAMLLADTGGSLSQDFSVGWASLATAGTINAYEIFRYGPSGQEAVVPMETRNASSYVLAFDNTSLVSVLGTGIALANVAAQAASIPVIIRDDSGAQIASASIPLAGRGHTAFVLADQYPLTAGKRGTVEFVTPPNGQISVLGIRAHGDAFTTIPAIASGSGGSGSMAHIASGGGWRSIFTVANTGAAPADVTLSFFDDGGNPLVLPLTFLQSGSTLTAATVTRTLAAGASLVMQAQGLTPQVSLGSAQLTTTGSASGFALFRYDPTGQEATAPLETRNAGAYVLAFDNAGTLKTGVALANLSKQATVVGVILRDDTGAMLQSAVLPLDANGHFSFVLDGNYPITAGMRGTVEFAAAAGAQISVLGIRANGDAFTSIPVLTR